ncbi:MAG: UDP-3-O-(3-hydroxymyristoyl)glucosamine N-acyltransferase [Planctomycetota bacterium]|jgi:UDP-3-O-[3-hydroxymyristoyl] glucosamine N-acyltransferase
MKNRTLGEIAELVGGRVCGDPTLSVGAVATLSQARAGDISFLVNRKYEKYVETTRATAVIVGREFESAPVPLVVVGDPHFAFMQVMVLLHGHRQHKELGVSPGARISETAEIGAGCHIHDFVTIADDARIGEGCVIYPCAYIGEDAQIGAHTVVHPSVTIYERCRIGRDVTINANSTIGVDGFGYATHDGRHHKIPQLGTVIVEDEVEIGSSCVIERGTLDNTVIGKGSKLGDLVTIGHGTRLGAHCLLVAQIGIAGSTTIGHHCVIGGQVGIVGHIRIGNNVTVGAQAGVVNDIPDGETVLGAPAIEANQARRAYTVLQHLPEMRQEIRSLKNRLRKVAAHIKTGAERPDEPKPGGQSTS